MSNINIPAPTNALVIFFNKLIDLLVLGVGEKVVIAQATAAQPWLALPVISMIFAHLVSVLGKAVDAGLSKNIDIALIRFQDDIRKNAYEAAIKKLETDTLNATTKEDHEKALKLAKETMDRLIVRSK
jgi:hypothetical protein